MDIQTPPTEKPYEPPAGERRGLIIVNTGDGKGKSTAAFGLALRAHGRGKAVKIYQFMKVPSARFGEHRVFEQLGVPVEGLGDGFSWKSQDLERSAQLARDGWARAKASILSGEYFLVVLDEPSMGLSPIMVDKIFEVVRDVYALGVTILLVEQNASRALALADRGYVMDSGLITMHGPGKELLDDARVRAAYLGE